ncbi:GYD domain-containing protein [Candidatus Woesearchaeota archaeon]|nr:GYD domain-containing protein [Candidatus Woesearchaeota archaeon]
MMFITLIKFRKKAKDVVEVGNTVMQNLPAGVKIIGTYWTLGRFDSVWIYEAPSEKEAIKLGISVGEVAQTQTLVAVPRNEALKLL